MLAALLLSLGTPMLLGGDEMRRSQRGNNNPWCQDNEISWYDWRLVSQHADLHSFCREMISFRRSHPAFLRAEFYGAAGQEGQRGPAAGPDVRWMTETGQPADWSAGRQTLMVFINGRSAALEADGYDNDILLMLNPGAGVVEFTLPARPAGGPMWHLVADTARQPPRDILPAGGEEPAGGGTVRVEAGSLVVLLAR